MKRSSAAILFIVAALILTTSAFAQMGPPTPAPELKKLDFMAGDWSVEGTLIAGPPGTPATKFSSNDHGEWLDGNFFLVIHSDVNSEAMGKAKDLAVLGYDSDKKTYTYTHYNSMGQTSMSTGTVGSDTWNWASEESYGGMSFKVKTTMKVLSPTSYTMKVEMSPDGANWMTALDVKGTKK